jgi:hypothetical protein
LGDRGHDRAADALDTLAVHRDEQRLAVLERLVEIPLGELRFAAHVAHGDRVKAARAEQRKAGIEQLPAPLGDPLSLRLPAEGSAWG